MIAVLSPIRLLSAALVLLALAAPALPAPGDKVDIRDVEIALHVRRAFMQDSELAELGIGVSVHLNEATVWGNIPTIRLAERALRLAEETKGVYAVHNDLTIHDNPRERTLRELVEGLASGGAPITPLPEATPESGTGLSSVLLGPPGETKPQQVFNARPDMPALEKSEQSEHPVSHSAVTLLPPVVTTAPAALTMPPVVLLAPRAAANPVKGLLAAVEQVRTADARFRDVRAEVSDGRVTLSGRVDDMETLIDLGRALSRVPGVQYVDLRGVIVGR
jgi:hypothetical protein